MAKKLTPQKVVDEVIEIKNILLEGKAIKIDARGYVEVTDDRYFGVLNPSAFSEQCFRSAVFELINEGYNIKKQTCNGSGCYQYQAVSYWLEVE